MHTFGLVPDGMYLVINGYVRSVPVLLLLLGAAMLLFLGWASRQTGANRQYNQGLAVGTEFGRRNTLPHMPPAARPRW